MLGSDYLSLASVRLKAGDKWASRSAGLTIVFLNAGDGQCVWHKGSQHLEPGDLLVLNGASGAQLNAATKRKLLFSFFSINFEHLFPLFSSEELHFLQSIRALFEGVTLYPASRALATKCHRLLKDVSPELGLDHRAQLLHIVAAILSFEFKNAQLDWSDSVPMDTRISQVFDKLSTAEILTLPVTQLAARFSCTRRHLTRLFQKQFGCSVSNLRMEIRLLRAVSLLRNPELTIGEVARQCGFNHRGLFNQCFRSRFGSSPTQWQLEMRKVESRRIDPMNAKADCRLRADGLCPWSAKSVDGH
jgi:AraC-like DNA-binding protein